MNELVEALKIIGPIAAGVLIAGAKPIAAYAEVIRARGTGRKSDPPSGGPKREAPLPPAHTLIGIGPVTRAEYEALVLRMVHLEDSARRLEAAQARLDERQDEETRARTADQQAFLREVGLISSRVSEIFGRMDGQAEGSRSRRGR